MCIRDVQKGSAGAFELHTKNSLGFSYFAFPSKGKESKGGGIKEPKKALVR
jgi:hypothetical protein